jgi:hypothetical protein
VEYDCFHFLNSLLRRRRKERPESSGLLISTRLFARCSRRRGRSSPG